MCLGYYIDGDQCAMRFICVKDGGIDNIENLEKKEKKTDEIREDKINALIP